MNKVSGEMAGQRGSVLLMSLIMLIVLTLIGVSVIRLGTTNLQLVNNMQGRHLAFAAATDVINQVLSTSFINESSIDAGLAAVQAATYTYTPDGTDASAKTYTVTLSKPCIKTMVQIKNIEIPALVAQNAAYKTCLGTGAYSTCYRSFWQFTASVKTGFLGSRIDVTQGAQVIVSQTAGIAINASTANFCTS